MTQIKNRVLRGSRGKNNSDGIWGNAEPRFLPAPESRRGGASGLEPAAEDCGGSRQGNRVPPRSGGAAYNPRVREAVEYIG